MSESMTETAAATPDGTSRAGHAWETFAVMALGACVVVLGLTSESLPRKMLLITALFGVFIFSFRAAYRSAYRVAVAQQERERFTLFKVSDRRLDTLRAAGVPWDVTSALAKLKGEGEMSEGDLLKKLAVEIDLGEERTNEYKNKILKYTKVDAPK